MMNQAVPPPPIPSSDLSSASVRFPGIGGQAKASNSPVKKQFAPLDIEFLRRTYITCMWFSAAMTLCVGAAFHATIVTLSFAAGALLSTLLLKSQEMFVRRLLRPKHEGPYTGWDARIPLFILVPAKYAVVIAGLWISIDAHWLNPVAIVFGVTLIQFAIVAKVLGKMMNQRMRPISEVYVRKTNS